MKKKYEQVINDNLIEEGNNAAMTSSIWSQLNYEAVLLSMLKIMMDSDMTAYGSEQQW